jgi:hypothetical protein
MASNAVFLMVLVFATAMTVAAWWRFMKARSSLTSQQEEITFLGLLANLLAFVLPFVYGFSSIFTLSLQRAIEWKHVLIGCWVLCALTLILSVVGSKQVRFPLLLSGVAVGVFWTMVPVGIL